MNCLARRVGFALIAAAVLAAFAFAPVPDGLERPGMLALGLTLFNITLWMGNVVPKPIAGLLVMILLPVLGVTSSLTATFKDFISSVFFFLLAAFAIAAMVRNSDLPQRLMGLLLRWLKGSSRLIVLAYMLAAAIISTVMSDLAACALFAAVVLAVFENPDLGLSFDKRFMKCVMIGVPIGALAGGIATPIGSSSNFTMLELLYQTNGMEISFFQWMVVGVPIAVISVLAGWAALCVTFRPQPLTCEEMDALRAACGNLGRLSVKEWKIIVLVTLMFVFWILTSYLPGIDSTMVAMLGMIIMFVPAMDLLTWDEYAHEVPWDLVIMLGCLMALASALLSTGAIDWVANTLLGGTASWHPFGVLFMMGAVIALLRAFVPSGPPIVVMLTPAMVTLAVNTGIDPLCVIMTMSIWAQITFLIPAIDALYLITYQRGHYSICDVLKFGVLLTIALLLVFTAILPPLVSLAEVL